MFTPPANNQRSPLFYTLVGCFATLLFMAIALMQLAPVIQQYPSIGFQQLDDDCDGIPNFRDAKYNADGARNCHVSAESLGVSPEIHN